MIEKKKLISYLIILTVLFSVITPIGNINKIASSFTSENQEKLHDSAAVTNTIQWITNGNFTSADNWTSTKGVLGDPTDVSASISGGQANFEVLGNKGRKEISDPINIANSGNWTPFNKTEPAINPDNYIIDNNGFHVNHSWHDATADQFASISWRYNVSMDVDMSDYFITSAFLNSTMYANVDWNIDTPNDVDARTGVAIDQPGIFDHAFFYVEIADMDAINPYRVAYNQTNKLGQDLPTTFYTIETKSIEPVGDEEDLIYYLNRVFENDPGHDNFTIIVGIEISCEDDYTGTDYDDWNELRIQSLNLTFTYEKKVDQFTSISWNQDGEKPIDISNNTISVNEALFGFKYQINDTWPNLSPNSEIRILINNIPHSETVKLSTATIFFQDAKLGGFDITSLIDENKNINLSIQVFLADTFELNRTITISIDEVYLNISYTETFADTPSNLDLFLDMSNKTLNPFIELPLGEILNVTIKYTINQTGTHIPNATVQLEGKVSDSLSENITFQQYTIMVNTSLLGLGVKILSVTAQKDVYGPQSIQFFVEITERATEIQLFIDGNQKNDGDTIQLEIVESINVTVNFRDNLTQQHLSNATVNLVGLDLLNETNNQYNITINAQDLGQGITVLTIFAQIVNYQSQSIQFFVEVNERATELQLFVDGNQKNDGDTIQLEFGGLVNVTVNFRDNVTKAHLPNATVDLVGRGLFNETSNQYNITVTSQDLGLGTSVLTIFTQLTNYQSQSIQFFVEVYERATELQLFIDSIQRNDGDTVQLEIGEVINITVNFRDNITKAHLPNAIVDLVGRGLLNETNNQYNITVSAVDLGQGITVLTIFAQLANYQSQSIQFFVEVIERTTELLLFVDSIQRNDGDTIQLEIDDSINVTVSFKDNITKALLSNATVNLIGRDQLSEINSQYNISIKAEDLDQGITVLTIFAQLNNYQSQSIQFFIEVVERSTELDLFLNNEYKSLDPVYSLTKGQSLNLTIKYTDNQTGLHINTGIVQLIGEGLLLNLTRDNILGQYYIILDTTILGIGVKLFTIVAKATNYQIKTVDPRITVNRISATINTEDGAFQIEVDVGGDVLLQIVLNDTIFGSIITNATVTYAWAYGQGELGDSDDDSIYETTLPNVQSGVFGITITAFAGDDYDFESFEITLIVSQPTTQPGTDLSWLVFVLIGAILGLVTIFIFYQTYFKYPLLVRKIRKIKKSVKKGRKTKPILVRKREEILRNSIEDHKKLLELELGKTEILGKINKTSIQKEV